LLTYNGTSLLIKTNAAYSAAPLQLGNGDINTGANARAQQSYQFNNSGY
jgi:hypothetical protein